MQAAQYKALGLLLFIFTAMVALLLLATPGIQAQGTPLPTATSQGTPLPTATSQGSPSTNPGGDNSNSNSDDDTAPLGAYIELNAKNHSTSAWSKVQWQDDGDQWHTVEGWCGTLDSKGQRRWWVAAKDFGTGPFRWVVQQEKNGLVLLTSRSFSLPSGARQTVQVILE